MPPLPVLLLPGLDGTGDLFAPMLQTAPPDLQPIVVALPPLGDYAALWNAIRPRIPRGSFAIVADLAIAREAGERVKALILCNTFVTPPVSTLLRLLPSSLLFSLPVPEWVIRARRAHACRVPAAEDAAVGCVGAGDVPRRH